MSFEIESRSWCSQACVYLTDLSVHSFVNLNVSLPYIFSVRLSVYLSLYLTVHQWMQLKKVFINLSTSLSACFYTSLSVCLCAPLKRCAICLKITLSLSVSLFINYGFVSVHPSICLSMEFSLSFVCLFSFFRMCEKSV